MHGDRRTAAHRRFRRGPTSASALCPGKEKCPGHPRAECAFGTRSCSHRVAEFRLNVELQALLDTSFTIAKQQQNSVVEVMQLLSVMQGGPNAEQVALPPPSPPPSPFYVLPLNISWVYGVEDSDVSLLLPQLRSWLAIPCCQYVWHCLRDPHSKVMIFPSEC